MGEEICCDELAREFRERTLRVDEQGSINVVDPETERVVIYDLRVCFFCGAEIAGELSA